MAERVTYANERLLAHVRDSAEFSVDETLMKSLLHTKYAHWYYEDEVRVFVSLDKNTIEGGLFFYPFSNELVLREVILGPRCEIPISRVRELIDRLYSEVYLIKARLAYKWFKVVQD